MSSSLNSRIVDLASPDADQARRAPPSLHRRGLLFALAALALLPRASVASSAPTADLTRWGHGEFRRFGFLVYEATLWAGDDPLQPPLALQLTYRRAISGATIAQASADEIRQLGLADDATLERWATLMTGLFPDVREGDSILGEYRPNVARFHFNGRLLGSVPDAAFARAFFGIWLDAGTSAPDLRTALLTPSARSTP